MILVAGIPDETPTAMVIDALEESGADYRVFDQRRAATAHIELEVGDARAGGTVGGTLAFEDGTVPLEQVRGLYLRIMDDALLPEMTGMAPDAPLRRRTQRLHELLLRFADLAPGRVLNRPVSFGSNHSKPYQAHAIRACGFAVPETVITNEPLVARSFIEHAWGAGRGVIYKSISGVRSIVKPVEPPDLERLDRIRWCPTQFQRQVPGVDVRVHVVGRTALAASIASEATDYRYAARQVGVEPEIAPFNLDPATRARCVSLAHALGLPLAGIDLRRTPDDEYVCFEVNPSPAFSFYEQRSGLPIAAAIARYLSWDAE